MYTVEMFEQIDSAHPWRNGHVLTLEQVKQRPRSVISHTFVILGESRCQTVMFYSDNHIFGVGRLPKNCVPCTTRIPYHIAPRPGFEDGYLATAADIIRFDEYCEPNRRVLQTTQELVDYLNEIGADPESETR